MGGATGPAVRGPWKRVSGVLILLLASVLVLALAPVVPVMETGIDRHSFVSTRNINYLLGLPFFPDPNRCYKAGGQPVPCSSTWWVAFNWSTLRGENMTFEFLITESTLHSGFEQVPLYRADNLSSGGYSFTCGGPEFDCSGDLYLATNSTPGEAWYFQWEVVYQYPTTEPVL